MGRAGPGRARQGFSGRATSGRGPVCVLSGRARPGQGTLGPGRAGPGQRASKAKKSIAS